MRTLVHPQQPTGRAVRAELLRSRSGWWTLAIASYSLLFPVLLWLIFETSISQAGSEDGRPLVFGSSIPIAVLFLGSWLVTREFYYKSNEQSSLATGALDRLRGKLVASVCWGTGASFASALIWYLLSTNFLGASFSLSTMVQYIVGVCFAAVIASVMGCAIGWLCQSYYLALVITMVLPAAVDVPLSLYVEPLAWILPFSQLVLIAGGDFANVPMWWSAGLSAIWAVVVLRWAAAKALREDESADQ